MRWAKHRHRYRLWRRHGSPNGYLFHCLRCEKTGLYPFKFVKFAEFWGKA